MNISFSTAFLGSVNALIIATACYDILFQVTPYLNEESIESLASQKGGGDLVSIAIKFGSNALSSAVSCQGLLSAMLMLINELVMSRQKSKVFAFIHEFSHVNWVTSTDVDHRLNDHGVRRIHPFTPCWFLKGFQRSVPMLKPIAVACWFHKGFQASVPRL
jgi:hypothetical protein